MARRKITKDGVKVKGMFRVKIVNDDGTVAGDSGYCHNGLSNLGIQNYLAGCLFGNTGSSQVNYIALGTGGTVATDGTALPGEVMSSTQRVSANKVFSSRTASNGSATQYLYGTFSAGFLSATADLSNIGLFNSNATDNTIFAGNTYSSSNCATNQAVNVTYQIQLG